MNQKAVNYGLRLQFMEFANSRMDFARFTDPFFNFKWD